MFVIDSFEEIIVAAHVRLGARINMPDMTNVHTICHKTRIICIIVHVSWVGLLLEKIDTIGIF